MAEHSGIEPIEAYILVKTEDDVVPEAVASDIARRLPEGTTKVVEGAYQIIVSLTADAEEYVTAAMRDHILIVDGVLEAEPLLWREGATGHPVRGFHHREEES